MIDTVKTRSFCQAGIDTNDWTRHLGALRCVCMPYELQMEEELYWDMLGGTADGDHRSTGRRFHWQQRPRRFTRTAVVKTYIGSSGDIVLHTSPLVDLHQLSTTSTAACVSYSRKAFDSTTRLNR
jgi:hypothetical protein